MEPRDAQLTAVSLEYNLDEIFKYHAPTSEQVGKYQRIRDAAKAFAAVVQEEVPTCHDARAAINSIRTATMFANAGIALDGKILKEIKE